jgi:hypothetical protein
MRRRVTRGFPALVAALKARTCHTRAPALVRVFQKKVHTIELRKSYNFESGLDPVLVRVIARDKQQESKTPVRLQMINKKGG